MATSGRGCVKTAYCRKDPVDFSSYILSTISYLNFAFYCIFRISEGIVTQLTVPSRFPKVQLFFFIFSHLLVIIFFTSSLKEKKKALLCVFSLFKSTSSKDPLFVPKV